MPGTHHTALYQTNFIRATKKKGHGLAARPPHQDPSLGRRDPQPGDAPEGPEPRGYKGLGGQAGT